MDATVPQIAAALLEWYDRHARVLPWRSRPGDPPPEPYRVWLSEVMLQQTTTAAVTPYFAEFTRRWPTVEALAAADESEVMAAWAGLGYYARARNLIACARAVAGQGGVFPATEAGLRGLPGLGAYSAAAIAAIAFDQPAVVIDANVERVVARLFGIAEPLPAARKAIRVHAAAITPNRRSGDFAQAMMDLGSTICTARNPQCLLCPVSGQCHSAGNDPQRFPVKPPKRERPTRQGKAWWVEQDGRVWLVRRPAGGMLGGMRALPDNGWTARDDGDGEAPVAGAWQDAGVIRHSFTHFDLALTILVGPSLRSAIVPGVQGEWWPVEELGKAGLPTLYCKAIARVEELRHEQSRQTGDGKNE